MFKYSPYSGYDLLIVAGYLISGV